MNITPEVKMWYVESGPFISGRTTYYVTLLGSNEVAVYAEDCGEG